MKAMMYKGYAALVEFDAEDRIFVGHIDGLNQWVAEQLERAASEAA